MYSILIVELTRLGDVVCMIPALGRLRSAYPEAHVTCVVQEQYAPLLEGLDLNLEAIGFEGTQTFVGLGRGLAKVRRMPADLACSMSPAKRNAILTLGSRAPVKAGYLRYVNAKIQYLHKSRVYMIGREAAASPVYGREHLSLRAMKVCDALGLADAPTASPEIRAEVMAQAHQRIAPFLTGVRDPFAVLHPFASWEYKQWPIEKFLGLARRVIVELNKDVVVICEEGERSRWQDALKGSVHSDRLHLFFSASVLDTAALLRAASVMVGNDSGPLHLAGLVGVPLVGLYGPASPDLTGPRVKQGVYLYKPVPCSPCDQMTCLHPENPCMNAIEIDEVLRAMRSANDASAHHQASAYA